MQIYIPSVNGITKEYASHLIPSKWLDQFTIRQPIQIYSSSGNFYLMDINACESLKDQLLDFFEKNAIPLLNDIIVRKIIYHFMKIKINESSGMITNICILQQLISTIMI